jgi:hypothetical protein
LPGGKVCNSHAECCSQQCAMGICQP